MRYTQTYRRLFFSLPCLTIGLIMLCAFISAYGMTFLGDDLNHGVRTAEKFPNWYQWPLAIPYQWLTGNGRFGDMIGNILLAQSPMWLLAALSAAMVGLFYYMAVRISFPRREALLPRLVVIAVIMFAFPWWDSFFLFVCRINYIWTSALTLLTLWVTLFREQRELSIRWCWLLVPLALAAGWGHEACGMPAVAALIIFFCRVRKFSSLPKTNRIILVAFIIGGLLSVTSPCSYSRLGAERIPDDSVPVLLVKSSFIALAFVLTVGVSFCCRSGRKKILSLCRTPWVVLAVASLCSMLFVAVGGVVGRSGLFSQMYALVALCILLRKMVGEDSLCRSGIPARVMSACLFLLMAAHECGVCAFQVRANRQLKLCRELFEASPDGVVYASPMQRDDFPWWTLGKNKACIDNDDSWLIEVYDMRLGQGRKHYRLLPPELRAVSGGDLKNEVAGGWIERDMPEGVGDGGILVRDGVQYIVVDFKSTEDNTLYFISPRILDPGDR